MSKRIRWVPKTLKQYRKRQRALYLSTKVVPTECHSDDHACDVTFDAAPWLKKATVKEIVALARCGWGGDYAADQVALDMAGTVEAIADMFKYIEARNRVNKEQVGFECRVEEEEARSWLKVNRPRVYTKLPKEE